MKATLTLDINFTNGIRTYTRQYQDFPFPSIRKGDRCILSNDGIWIDEIFYNLDTNEADISATYNPPSRRKDRIHTVDELITLHKELTTNGWQEELDLGEDWPRDRKPRKTTK